MVIMGEQGELITEKEEILKRRKDSFTNLLNILQPISNQRQFQTQLKGKMTRNTTPNI
jgi:hypothetical protein